MAEISFGEWLGLAGAVIWAATALMLRTQSFRVPPVVMNAARSLAGAVFFWILLPFGPPLSTLASVPGTEWALLFGAVVIGPVTGETLYLSAIKEIGIARTLALTGTFPLTTLLWEQILLDEPVTRTFVAGSCLVVLGIICLSMRAGVRPGSGDVEGVRLKRGVLLSLGATLLWGLSTTMLKPAIANLTVVQANAIRLPTVALVLFGVWFATRHDVSLRQIDRRSLLVVAAAGIIGTGFGSLAFLGALSLIGPAKTATLSSSAPVFGLAFGVLFLKEKLSFRLILGISLCLTGVWLAL